MNRMEAAAERHIPAVGEGVLEPLELVGVATPVLTPFAAGVIVGAGLYAYHKWGGAEETPTGYRLDSETADQMTVSELVQSRRQAVTR
ncbi:hypothetical protein [Micromonospora arborensis]|uniref:hypothetical protein n=1 Tax=Micromonospora arborensis TaxID=2116518 RepID=UPI003715F807